MLSIRSGKGFGDSLYLQGVARHLVKGGQQIEVCSDYPDVFRPLNGRITISPFRRNNVSKVAHYIPRKREKGTDQFVDCCISVGIYEPVEFRLDWSPINVSLIKDVRKSGKPVIVVQLPRNPMDRIDGYGSELLPDCATIQRAIDRLRRRCFIVQVGKGRPLYQFTGIDLDLANRTPVSDVIDVVSAADGVLGYCSFIVPLAESLFKPALLVWSRRGLNSANAFISAIKPPKILHRSSSRALMDDATTCEFNEAVDAFLEQVASPALV